MKEEVSKVPKGRGVRLLQTHKGRCLELGAQRSEPRGEAGKVPGHASGLWQRKPPVWCFAHRRPSINTGYM